MRTVIDPMDAARCGWFGRLQLGDGEVLRIERCLPTLLAGDLPRGTARHTICKEPHLQLREALVVLQRNLLGDLSAAHARQQQRECLRAHEARSHDLMRRTDLHTLPDEVQQGRSIDHVASHPCRG